MREKLRTPQAASCFSQRGVIVEPCFAKIKAHDGFRRWTMWGLQAAQAQWALLCTTVNLRILYKRWRMGRPFHEGGAMAARRLWAGWIEAKLGLEIA